MRNRARGHGVVEFTNQDRGSARQRARDAAQDREGAPGPLLARGDRMVAPGGTFWARERPGGIVEFTNLRPSGKNWKVWLKAGPGKASALRGRTDVVPPRDRTPARFSRYDKDIHDQQAFYGIPEPLVRAVIKTESDFDPNVVSSAGAQGLMQLMPETARLMGVTSAFDGRQNIMGGARYLQILARRFCRTPVAADDGAQAGGPVLICSDDEKVKVDRRLPRGAGGGLEVRRDAPLRDDPNLRHHGAAPVRRVPARRRDPGPGRRLTER